MMKMLAITFGLWIVYCLACLCLGALLRQLIAFKSDQADSSSGVVWFATAFLLGQGGLASLWLLLALGGRFSPFIAVIILIIVILVGLKFAWSGLGSFKAQLLYYLSALWAEGWFWKGLTVLSLLVLVLKGMSALLPPDNDDAVAFYLALPKAIAASHRLVPLPGYESFTQVGFQGEMHFAVLMMLGSVQAAKFFLWSNSFCVLLLLSAIGKKLGVGRRGQIITLVILVNSTAFTNVTADGKVDLFGAAMGLAALYWALENVGSRMSFALRLTGLFAGLAVIAKVSYLLAFVPAIVLLVAWQYLSANKSVQSKYLSLISILAVLGLCMVLPAVPHMIKNTLLFHEPLAPFISFYHRGWAKETWFGPAITTRIVLTYPLVMVFGQYPMQYGNLSPLILAFAPLVLKLPRPRSWLSNQIVQLTVAILVGIGFWVAFRPSVVAPRYILALLLALIPLAAYSAEYVERTELRPRLLTAGIVMVLSFMVFSSLNLDRKVPMKTVKYLSGRLSDCDIAGLGCSELTAIDRDAQTGERVYLGSYFRYWLRPDLLQCVSTTDEQLTLTDLKTKEARWEYLVDRGFHYLVIDKATHLQTANALEIERPPAWVDVVPIMRDERFTAYRLTSRDPARQPHFGCSQIAAPAWDVVAR
jgi:hypothetical protein